MFGRGGPQGVGDLGVLFKFWCLKWPILTEMTVKYGKYFQFFLPTRGGYPPCGAEWWGPDPPPGRNPGV